MRDVVILFRSFDRRILLCLPKTPICLRRLELCRAALELKNLALRHQIGVLQLSLPKMSSARIPLKSGRFKRKELEYFHGRRSECNNITLRSNRWIEFLRTTG